MPLYRPTVFGAVAAAIFFILALLAIKDQLWRDVLTWLLLGVAFAISVGPGTVLGSRTRLIAGGILVIGLLLFLLDAAERL